MEPHIHGGDGGDRVEPQLLAHNPRLRHVAHQGDDPPQGRQPRPQGRPPQQQLDCCPGKKDGAAAQYRQDVQGGDEGGHGQKVVHPQQPQPRCQLQKGEEQDEKVGPAETEHRPQQEALGAQEGLPHRAGQMGYQEAGNLVVVQGDEHRGEKGEHQGESGGRKGGGQMGDAVHGGGGKAAQAAHPRLGEGFHQLAGGDGEEAGEKAGDPLQPCPEGEGGFLPQLGQMGEEGDCLGAGQPPHRPQSAADPQVEEETGQQGRRPAPDPSFCHPAGDGVDENRQPQPQQEGEKAGQGDPQEKPPGGDQRPGQQQIQQEMFFLRTGHPSRPPLNGQQGNKTVEKRDDFFETIGKSRDNPEKTGEIKW